MTGVILDWQVFYYSAGVFETSGIPVDMIQYAVLGTGIINVIMTGISVRTHTQRTYVQYVLVLVRNARAPTPDQHVTSYHINSTITPPPDLSISALKCRRSSY